MAKRKGKGKKAAKARVELASPREFGEKLSPKVSRQAVMKAITAGRLRESAHKTDRGWWRIEIDRGRAEWDAWTDHAKAEGGRAKAGGRPSGSSSPTPPTTGGLFPDSEDGERIARQRLSHAEASTDRIQVDAELKRLELERQRGRLVDRASVQREAFTLARSVRDRILMVPDRIAPELAGTSDVGDVHRRLLEELLDALAALAEDIDDGELEDDDA